MARKELLENCPEQEGAASFESYLVHLHRNVQAAAKGDRARRR